MEWLTTTTTIPTTETGQPTESDQRPIRPQKRKTEDGTKTEDSNPIVHKFKQLHPGYNYHDDNIINLHQDTRCSTEKAPLSLHGSWRIADGDIMLLNWNYKGDQQALSNHTLRRISRTECWELIDSRGSWYYILIPAEWSPNDSSSRIKGVDNLLAT